MASGNLVSGSIPNLIGGVSQQPWNVRMPSQAEAMLNCHATITEFMRRRPALKMLKPIASPDGSSNFASLAIDKGTNEQYIALFGKGGIKVYDLEGNEQAVNISDSGRKYLGQAEEAAVDFRFCTIKDYTFCVNSRVIVSEGVTTDTTRAPEAIVFVKQASYQTTYKLTLNGTTYSYTTPDGVYEEGTTPPELSANGILNQLKAKIEASTSIYSITIKSATMWIKRVNNAYFTFGVSDSRSNTHIVAFRDSIQKMTDLPVVAPNGILLRVTGDSSTSLDDYYIKFEVTDGSGFGAGTWVETVAPATNNKIDPATMPHALIRRKANTFSFEPIAWKERAVGDAETNPMPSFVGSRIANILFYRNRLTFLSGDNVVMSEANEFFNFFLTTLTTAVDSDPIDVAASGTKDTSLYASAIYNGGLLLFSTKGQFALEHDTVLSNSTVSLIPVTEFESTDRAVPVSSGKTIFFAVDRGQWVGVREYIAFDSDNMESNDATDVSSHVPRYIPGKVSDLQCSSNEDILLVRSSSEPSAVWVYKYFWDGNNKAQSAWYKWEMAGNIWSNLFFNTEVYCVMEYEGKYFLETFSFEPSRKDVGEDFEFCLDRKVDESFMSIGAYDPLTKTTTLTLPYDDDRAVIITRSGGDLRAGCLLEVESKVGPTYVIKGKVTANSKLFAGVPYLSDYTFTTLAIRNENQTAVTTGRLQLRNMSLNLSKTGFIKTEIKPRGKTSSVYTFTGKRLGEASATIGSIPIFTGQIKTPVLSKSNEVTIHAFSDSPLPFAIVNVDWEGFYTTRNQKL